MPPRANRWPTTGQPPIPTDPYNRPHGADNPAAVVPVRSGEDVIVGLLLNLPKLQAEHTRRRWAGSPCGKGKRTDSNGRDGNGNRRRFRRSIPPAQRREVGLSLTCCRHLGGKLPDATSCGALCAEFPRCLPSLPTTVGEDFAELHEHLAGRRETLLRRLAFLEQLDDAITQGLERKDNDHRETP